MFNTAKMLERSFTPTDGGYLFYTSRWSGGYLVTDDEYQALIGDWRKRFGFGGMLKLLGLTVLAIVVLQVSAEFLGAPETALTYVTFSMAAILIGYIGWHGMATTRLVKGRQPITPPRSSLEAETQMGRSLGRPMAIWMAILSLWFLLLAVTWAYASPLIGIPIALVVAVVAYFNIRIAIRSFRRTDG